MNNNLKIGLTALIIFACLFIGLVMWIGSFEGSYEDDKDFMACVSTQMFIEDNVNYVVDFPACNLATVNYQGNNIYFVHGKFNVGLQKMSYSAEVYDNGQQVWQVNDVEFY